MPLSGTWHPGLEEAVNRAIEERKSNAIIHGHIWSWAFVVPLLYRQHRYTVEGTVNHGQVILSTRSVRADLRNAAPAGPSVFDRYAALRR
jgi:hypothetical protein